MYYPYFRGKQYELITIRECADILSGAGFIPIIEPVKESLSGLIKAIDAIIDANGKAILIVNPHCGEHERDTVAIFEIFNDKLKDNYAISAGMVLSETASVDEIIDVCKLYHDRAVTLIHYGFTAPKVLAQKLGALDHINVQHVFDETKCGKLYQKHFRDDTRILLRDGFEKRTNKNHPPVEYFSDLHITYEDEGMNGFGDFLMVGDEYSTSGGPAYAIAIHITFIDPEKDDAMYIHHFISDTQHTPKDPAGKFSEALKKLVNEVEQPESNIFRTKAINEFIQLHKRKHFPGLGYVKKLSMQHHIETLAEYLNR